MFRKKKSQKIIVVSVGDVVLVDGRAYRVDSRALVQLPVKKGWKNGK